MIKPSGCGSCRKLDNIMCWVTPDIYIFDEQKFHGFHGFVRYCNFPMNAIAIYLY